MGGKKPLRRPLWPPTRATASNYYPLGLDGAGGAAKPLLRAPKKPAPLHGRLPAFSGAVDAFERARKCFLEWRYFFSIILSEFLKNRVALQFHDPDVRDYIENVRRSHDQIIDNTNIDSVLFAGFDTQQEENADRILATFHEFIEENKDEIIALRIIYNESYKDRPMAIEQLKELYGKLKAKGITVERLWDCYAIKKPDKVKRGTMAQLTDLISIIRFEMGYTDNLSPFADKVNYNFMQWTFKRNAGHIQFTEEQMEWLRLIKDHIATSLSILPEDLDLTPFDKKGGLLGFYESFGDDYEVILNEMNRKLVA